MGIKKDTLLGLHIDFVQGLRLNYYSTWSTPDQVPGITPHSDTSILTILMRDEDVIGLQIKHSEEWVPVKPISKCPGHHYWRCYWGYILKNGKCMANKKKTSWFLIDLLSVMAMTDLEQWQVQERRAQSSDKQEQGKDFIGIFYHAWSYRNWAIWPYGRFLASL